VPILYFEISTPLMQIPLKNFLWWQAMKTLFEASAISGLALIHRPSLFSCAGAENFRYLHAGLDFLLTFSAMEKVRIDVGKAY
jgi:hypothetical protein